MSDQSNNPDAPVAEVNTGLSEIVSIGALVSAILTIFFGHDFGVAQHAQDLAPLILAVVPVGLGFSRAFKHHSAAMANAHTFAALAPLDYATSQDPAPAQPANFNVSYVKPASVNASYVPSDWPVPVPAPDPVVADQPPAVTIAGVPAAGGI